MKNKKLTLKDFSVTSFVTSEESKTVMGGLVDCYIQEGNEAKDFQNFGLDYQFGNNTYAQGAGMPATMDQTGNTQCKAKGGCVDATMAPACYTAVGGCNATADCITAACSLNC